MIVKKWRSFNSTANEHIQTNDKILLCALRHDQLCQRTRHEANLAEVRSSIKSGQMPQLAVPCGRVRTARTQ